MKKFIIEYFKINLQLYNMYSLIYFQNITNLWGKIIVNQDVPKYLFFTVDLFVPQT